MKKRLVLPNANAQGLALHLDEISKATQDGHHAVVVLDRAGYHMAHDLPEYENLSLLRLPPFAPELNSSERLWEWMREHDLSNKAFDVMRISLIAAARLGINCAAMLDD